MNNINKTTKTVLIIAIVVIINLISLQLFTRVDLTRGNRYSISDYSKNLVSNLDDKLTIKAFFSEKIPPPYNKLKRDVKDKLAEYKAYANRYFQFEFVKSDNKDEFVKDARSYGIPQVRVNAIEKDEAVIKNVVMGLVIQYEGESETIPMIKNTRDLEYKISAKINKLINKELPKIGFLQGHGELSFENDLKKIKQRLQENYQLESVNLQENSEALNNLEVLVVAGPKKKIPLSEQYKIDQFIMQGKKVMFLISRVEADIQSQRPKAEFYPNDMQQWFSDYGFNVKRNLVYDQQCQTVQVQQQMGGSRHISFMQYPFLINVSNFNKDNMIVKQLNKPMTLVFPSSIDTTLISSKGLDFSTLAYSSKKAGTQNRRLNISIQNKQLQYTKSNIPLAAVITGKFSSSFTNRTVPDSVNLDTSGMIESGMESRILVVGNSQFIQNQYLTPSNALFFANSVDWLAQEKGLIQIRSKQVGPPQLAEVSAGTKSTIKFLIRFLPTILIIIIGFVMWHVRKKRYKKFRRYLQ